MKHDLIHIQGKPFVVVPLHEYRQMAGASSAAGMEAGDLPPDLIDRIFARQSHPVKLVRAYRGMTQADLAAASGLSRPYLTEIETGKKEGSLNAIKALAKALNVPTGVLC